MHLQQVQVGAVWTIFLIYHFSLLSPFLWNTARCRLKYCLKGPLNQNNQPTIVVVLLFYVHGKHLRSCRDGTNQPIKDRRANSVAR